MEILSPSQAANLIPSGATIIPGGFGSCGHPDLLTEAIEKSFIDKGYPRDLTLLFASGAGDKKGKGLDRLAHNGLIKKAVGGFWNLCPKLRSLGEQGVLEAHNWPQGVISKLFSAIADGSPGLISKVGLKTFVDPRLEGGVFKPCDFESLVEVIRLKEEEFLFYPSFPVDVALLRATAIDIEGNISLSEEASKMDALAQAQAARNSGGVVIFQVKRLHEEVLSAGEVHIPAHLVDAAVLSDGESHPYTYGHYECPCENSEELYGFSRDINSSRDKLVKRALIELPVGEYKRKVVNFGIGIPAEIGLSLSHEQIRSYTISVESGVIGGSPLIGNSFGASVKPSAILDQSQLFTLYDGGGIYKAFLGFAQIDYKGRVNVSNFSGVRPGAGGFINITSSAKKLVFCGLIQANVRRGDGFRKINKLVRKLDQVTFDPEISKAEEIKIITEIAVFVVTPGGLMLKEIEEGWQPGDIRSMTDFDFSIDESLSYLRR